jgi:hypothetical protein
MPALNRYSSADLATTKEYLQDLCLAVSDIQRSLIPKESHSWDYGLEVSMRGILSQELTINGKKERILVDLYTSKVRFLDKHWDMQVLSPSEIYDELLTLPELPGVKVDTGLTHSSATLNKHQLDKYADSLWAFNDIFNSIKTNLTHGLISPVLLYPHHFDISLSWFPLENDSQVTIGFLLGDESIEEPYFYLTTYPDQDIVSKIELPKKAYVYNQAFKGLIINYADLETKEEWAEAINDIITQLVRYYFK